MSTACNDRLSILQFVVETVRILLHHKHIYVEGGASENCSVKPVAFLKTIVNVRPNGTWVSLFAGCNNWIDWLNSWTVFTMSVIVLWQISVQLYLFLCYSVVKKDVLCERFKITLPQMMPPISDKEVSMLRPFPQNRPRCRSVLVLGTDISYDEMRYCK